MNAPRPSPLLRVPTLTEVVEFDPPASAAPAATLPPIEPRESRESRELDLQAPHDFEQRVLANLQRHLDAACESRLRAAIAPVLARSAEALIRELHGELTSTLHGLVARAVAQELARGAAPERRDGGATPD